MKTVLGILIIIGGIALGIWIGIWICLVGGIIQIVEALKATPVSSWGIAWGIVRVLLTSLAGWGSFGLCVFAGGALVGAPEKRSPFDQFPRIR